MAEFLNKNEQKDLIKCSQELQGMLIKYANDSKYNLKIFSVALYLVHESLMQTSLKMYKELAKKQVGKG